MPLESRRMILDTNNISNYLVLGHNGFLGKLILNKLESRGERVRVLGERLTCENVESLFSRNIDQDTRIFNCIASGVTPNTGDELIDSFTNHSLLESQLKTLTNLRVANFTHFASNYENMHARQNISSRNSYVLSKSNGSKVCRSFLEHDSRIQLMYLPTVIHSSQPRGRLFADFMHAFMGGQKFYINFPKLPLQMISFESLWNNLEILEKSANHLQVSLAPADVTLTAVSYTHLTLPTILRV